MSLVFQNIDPPPPPNKGGGYTLHTRRAERGVGGQYFGRRETQDCSLTVIISLRIGLSCWPASLYIAWRASTTQSPSSPSQEFRIGPHAGRSKGNIRQGSFLMITVQIWNLNYLGSKKVFSRMPRLLKHKPLQ